MRSASCLHRVVGRMDGGVVLDMDSLSDDPSLEVGAVLCVRGRGGEAGGRGGGRMWACVDDC